MFHNHILQAYDKQITKKKSKIFPADAVICHHNGDIFPN